MKNANRWRDLATQWGSPAALGRFGQFCTGRLRRSSRGHVRPRAPCTMLNPRRRRFSEHDTDSAASYYPPVTPVWDSGHTWISQTIQTESGESESRGSGPANGVLGLKGAATWLSCSAQPNQLESAETLYGNSLGQKAEWPSPIYRALVSDTFTVGRLDNGNPRLDRTLA